ncbi:MAG TPA: recombinase family protein [Longimicrobiaceae bacterium]|nr:recombinase family protein [Longimicrobiaceae bacterium]
MRAYSYTRFSSPEQAAGDSFRRQTSLAQKYALERGLDLDDRLTFHDLGVSAFRGANAATGRLAAFLEAVRGGLVEPGSYLLVESLDRISRQTARTALRVLEQLVDEGVTVVTLSDGREYTADRLDNDPTALLLSLLVFIRANEESATKARRLRSVWEAKRATATARPLTGMCPGWLELDRRAGAFVVREDRAEVVRRIFRDTLAGSGRNTIAKRLNEEGVPPFGKAARWHDTYVAKILESEAVVGIFEPHRVEHADGKRVRTPTGEKVPGYFPPVVDAETFAAVRELARARAARRGKGRGRYAGPRGRHAAEPVRNLFGGLLICGRCGGTVTRQNKGRPPKGAEYLVCVAAKTGAGCKYEAIRYDAAERYFLARAAELIEQAPAGETDEDAAALLEQTRHNLWGLEEEVERLLDSLQRAPSLAIEGRLLKLETVKLGVEKELRGLAARSEWAQGPSVRRRLDELAQALQAAPLDRTAANAIMRQAFRQVVVDFDAAELVLHWQHGGESRVEYSTAAYGFPVERGAPPK